MINNSVLYILSQKSNEIYISPLLLILCYVCLTILSYSTIKACRFIDSVIFKHCTKKFT